MKSRGDLLLPILAILILPGQVQATEPASSQIYQWTNIDGEMQFSDRPPPNGAKPDKVLSVPKPTTGTPDNGGDTFSIENQAQRMESDRKQREAQRRQAELEHRKTRLLEIEERKSLAELAEAEARAQREQDAAYQPIYPGYIHPIPPHPGCCRWDQGNHLPVRPVYPVQPVAPPLRPMPRTHINAPFRTKPYPSRLR